MQIKIEIATTAGIAEYHVEIDDPYEYADISLSQARQEYAQEWLEENLMDMIETNITIL